MIENKLVLINEADHVLSMYLKQESNHGLTLPNYSVIGEEKVATVGGRKTMFRLTAQHSSHPLWSWLK